MPCHDWLVATAKLRPPITILTAATTSMDYLYSFMDRANIGASKPRLPRLSGRYSCQWSVVAAITTIIW
ncbi:unnamed protein product [Dovyalis caffra]|uniref:Uncharacterized protein n=1 Tax=Dovyalis caffra TaxID=77055 RepID=A0AAV1R816_9ROSI|nr:unnamed protein product [Dovyalis caffra]